MFSYLETVTAELLKKKKEIKKGVKWILKKLIQAHLKDIYIKKEINNIIM